MTKEILSPALELPSNPSIDRRIHFLGVPLDNYSMAETLEIAEASMKKRRRLQHVVVNVGKLVAMRHNAVLRRDVEESDLINIDGTVVLLGCRLLGHDVDERVAGIDLMANLLALCEREGVRPYILGAKQEVLQRATEVLRERHPNLEIAGYRNGYFSEDDEAGVVAEINASGADCLFVAISSPHKENFLHRHRDDFTVPFLMGVGGSVDVLAGYVKRAPRWMQDFGLEWFYRMIQEPGRMWRRYFFTNTVYAGLLLRALWAKFTHGGDAQRKIRWRV